MPSVVVVERERRFSPVGKREKVTVAFDEIYVARRGHVPCTEVAAWVRRFSPVGTADIADVVADNAIRPHAPRSVVVVRVRRKFFVSILFSGLRI